jgi:hypothetical protein
VRFIIEKWILLEYSCVYLPAQQHAVVESVSKGQAVPDLGKAAELFSASHPVPPAHASAPDLTSATPRRVCFTPLGEIESALRRRLAALDLPALAQQAVRDGWHRLRGGV